MNRIKLWHLGVVFFATALWTGAMAAAQDARLGCLQTSLDGEWFFRRDGAKDWRTVQVPSSFQSHEGTNFHGIGWYRKLVNVPAPAPGKRMLLHFEAAATETEVWWDGNRLGTHLGGWTPFRFAVTDLLRNHHPPNAMSCWYGWMRKQDITPRDFCPLLPRTLGDCGGESRCWKCLRPTSMI
jgi:hypothetical protein